MLIAFWQAPLRSWSESTAQRRIRGLIGKRRWNYRRGEQLESRQFLTAGALPVGPPALAGWHAAFSPEVRFETNREDSPALGLADEAGDFTPPSLSDAREPFRDQPGNELNGRAALEPLATPPFDEAGARAIDFVVVAPPVIRFLVPERPLVEPVDSSFTQSMTSIVPMPVDPHPGDPTADREVVFVFEGWQPTDVGQFYSADASLDVRAHMVEIPHEFLADARLALLPPDGTRSTASGGISIDPAAMVERQGSAGAAIVLGQNAETEPALASGGRSVLGALPGGLDEGELARADGSSAARGAVGYLVAFGETALTGGAVSLPAEAREGLLESLVQDLLTPRFTCDAASLSVAIQDLAAQVDELSSGLLEVLAYPATTGETALVAGLVGGGLAYRHWHGGQRQQRAEEEELLSSRFLRGHASLRLAGGRRT